jgi:glycosyltransferase involved in cell wall biosynthesis
LDNIHSVLEQQFPNAALALNNCRDRTFTFVPSRLDVIFLVGLTEGESKRYRIFNVVETLESAGYHCGIYFEDDIERILERRPKFSACVIFRAPLSPRYEALVDYARSISARTVWDVDDFVFDVRIIPQIDGLKYLTPQQRIKNAEGIRLYRKFLTAVDAATTTTRYLAERIIEVGQLAFVIPNTLNREQIAFAEKHGDVDVRNQEVITLGFFSGTKTHDRDFQEARHSVVQILERYSNVRLVIVGHFDIEQDSDFGKFCSRVEKVPFVPHMKMLDLLRYIDIILVPLEMIPYCHGKSELKFFEAALVGCVTVASATDTYSQVIEHGVNGFVCHTDDDWLAALDLLCSSAALRGSIAAAARQTVLNRYVMDAHLPTIAEAYGLPFSGSTHRTMREAPVTSVKAGPRVLQFGRSPLGRGAFLLPDLLIGGGGHRKAIMFASALEQAGIAVDLVFQGSTRSPEELSDIINGSYSPFLGSIRLFSGSLTHYSWLVATSWSTAMSVIERRFPPQRVIYLVQDFEPTFYAMGSDFIRAEATYLAGFNIVTFGNWVGAYLRKHYGLNCATLPFSLDRSIYYFQDAQRSERLLFFAKPEMSRRCFEISSEALRIFSRICPDVEICLFGSDKTRGMRPGFEFTDLGVITDLERLASLYARSQLGIAISTTNPSILGYEMLACGCPVVDIDRPDIVENYGGKGLGIIPVKPFARDYANVLTTLMTDRQSLRRHQSAAPSLVQRMPTDSEVSLQFVDYVRGYLSRVSGLSEESDNLPENSGLGALAG